MSLSLVILAAGLARRYGTLKQLEPVGPAGEALFEFAVHDAVRSGFDRIILVIRSQTEPEFRTRMAARWSRLDVRFALQDHAPLPAGSQASRTRSKPWGTGHAVLAAMPHVDSRFAVLNADDFYGTASIGQVARELQHMTAGDAALVGFRLDSTLSAHGGVSRALCRTDDAGWLTGIVEFHDIYREHDRLQGRAADATGAGAERMVMLDPAARVSLNLWGFDQNIFALLEDGLRTFVERFGRDDSAEFLLPQAVAAEIAQGRLRVRVLPGEQRWMGLTFAEDRTAVIEQLRARVAAGDYPSPLGL